MIVLALCGLKRAGKDTVARILQDTFRAQGKTCSTLAFADALRNVCSVAFGVPVEDFSNDLTKDVPHEHLPNRMTPRDALILVGTTMFRKMVDPDFWIHAALAQIRRAHFDVVILTDVRFENELQAVREQFDTKTILVVRQELESTEGLHETERFAAVNSCESTRTFNFDFVVHNKTTLEDLEASVRTIFCEQTVSA
jgi:hypothetical protein